MPIWSARQPSLYFGRFVGGVVVYHQKHVRAFGQVAVQFFQEVQELCRAMPFVAFANHRPGRNVQRSKKRSRAVSDVCVRRSAMPGSVGRVARDRAPGFETSRPDTI